MTLLVMVKRESVIIIRVFGKVAVELVNWDLSQTREGSLDLMQDGGGPGFHCQQHLVQGIFE